MATDKSPNSRFEVWPRMTSTAIDHLQKEKQKFEALFNFATIGIVISNSRGIITLANQKAAQIFGYGEGELEGNEVEILIPTDKATKHRQERAQYTVHPQVRAMGAGRDLMAKRKDGSQFPCEVSLSYFHTDEGLFVIAFVLDVTIRKENEAILLKQKADLEKVSNEIKLLNQNLEQEVHKRTVDLLKTLNELEQSRIALEKALENEKQLGDLKSRFVTMASHEFKTPLSTILTSATLLGKYRTTEEQPQREKHLKRISDTVIHLSGMLNDFLSLGKLEEGAEQPKFENINPLELVQEVVAQMQSQADDGKTIRLNADSQVEIKTDPAILQNVLLNLASNAVKFSKPNGLIQIDLIASGKQLKICVKDEGIGISKEDQKHLFERFYRGKNAENIKGTGLGLHLVQRYVEMLGGSIKIDSKLNKGTSIEVLLPLT